MVETDGNVDLPHDGIQISCAAGEANEIKSFVWQILIRPITNEFLKAEIDTANNYSIAGVGHVGELYKSWGGLTISNH